MFLGKIGSGGNRTDVPVCHPDKNTRHEFGSSSPDAYLHTARLRAENHHH